MTQADKLVSAAVSQIGERENPPGSNMTKYGAAYGWNGVAWCCIFVWWCFREAGLSSLFYNGNKTASCTALMKWAANCGRFVVKDFAKGDVFLYDYDNVKTDSEHTGIYTGEMVNGKYKVVEGNYADAVCMVERNPGEIIGAFRPAWQDEGEAPQDGGSRPVTVSLPELSKGSRGASVEAMQMLLEGNGYSCGRYGRDGDFGNDTASALRSYQQYHGLEADAVCGIRTWSKLLGV